VKARKAGQRMVDGYADAIPKQDSAEAEFANLNEPARIALFSSPLSFCLLFLRRYWAPFFPHR